MTPQEEQDEEGTCALRFVGLDEALLGIADTWDNSGNRYDRYIYSGGKIIDILMKDSEMDAEEALEFFDFNIDCAYVGVNTPIVMWPVNGGKYGDLGGYEE